MAIREVQASGLEYLALATALLQRARHAEAGLREAADLQWWWRTPRRSDAIGQLFWVDEEGPVAAVVLTDWGRVWGAIRLSLRVSQPPPSGRARWRRSTPWGWKRSRCSREMTNQSCWRCSKKRASRPVSDPASPGWTPRTGPVWPRCRKGSCSSPRSGDGRAAPHAPPKRPSSGGSLAAVLALRPGARPRGRGG